MTHQTGRISRRRLLAGAALACGRTTAASEQEISHQAESIHQERVFEASPKRVYAALLDTKLFDQALREAMKTMSLQNKPALIEGHEGGRFSLFGGHILGRQIELVPSQRIVQAWRTTGWNPGHYSIARFELSAHSSSQQRSATKLVFDHTGFPADQAQNLLDGWNAHYWAPLAKYLS